MKFNQGNIKKQKSKGNVKEYGKEKTMNRHGK